MANQDRCEQMPMNANHPSVFSDRVETVGTLARRFIALHEGYPPDFRFGRLSRI